MYKYENVNCQQIPTPLWTTKTITLQATQNRPRALIGSPQGPAGPSFSIC